MRVGQPKAYVKAGSSLTSVPTPQPWSLTRGVQGTSPHGHMDGDREAQEARDPVCSAGAHLCRAAR